MSRDRKPPTFRDIVADVKPLPPRPMRVPAPPTEPEILPASDPAKSAPLVVHRDGETIAASAAGVNRALLVRLSSGTLRPQAELDVHGMATAQAERAVSRFLRSARERGLKTVLVIHGRGLHSGPLGPVLRDAVIDWIAERHADDVLALVTAARVDGGPGATIVRFRRSSSSGARRQ
jgi:DNA-nicking Smr family endonuclease